MPRPRLLTALALPALALTACGVPVLPAGPTTSETLDVPEGITAVRVDGRGTLVVQQGAPDLRVTGGRELVEDVEVRALGDELVLGLDEDLPWGRRGELVYQLWLPAWEGLAVSGSGTVMAPEDAGVGVLRVDVSGSGEVVTGQVSREDVQVDVSGSGEVRLEGSTDALGVVVAGSGDVDAAGLRARDVAVDVSGSGDVEVAASESLLADVSGSGDVVWTGAARDVRTHVSGSGDITRR